MNIRIITDSASDILQSDAKEMGITVIPLKTIFSTGEYIDGVNLSHTEFFEKLIETREISKTSQITPMEYIEEYSKYPNDEVIVITLSKKLSGCYQSAALAANEFNNVYVVDSENATIGERLLVELAVKLVGMGKTAKEIIEIIEKKKDICLVALLDTLEYLKKGGRISFATAYIGTLLNIKPVITIDEGKVKSLGKARGSKNGNNMLRKLVNEAGGMDLSLPYAVAYSGLSDALLKKYLEDNKDLYPKDINDLPLRTIGSTIGTHVGPGAIAVAFFRNK